MSADKMAVAVKPKVSTANNMIIRGYHRTKSKDSPESIAYLGFDAKLSEKITNSDPLYGPGFYLTRNLIDHLRPHYNRSYGEVIIQNEINMEGVLIFDLALSVKVFGEPKTILQQFIDRKIKLESVAHLNRVKSASDVCANNSNYSEYYSADEAKSLYVNGVIDITKWAGIAYTGRQDGACVVMYKTNQVFPRIWSHYDFKALERLYREEDPQLVKNKSRSNDDDEDDYDDDDDDDNEFLEMDQQAHFIVSKLKWNKLNAREVNKIRSGFDTRFCRWIEQFSKLPLEKASDRFNQCLTRLENVNTKSFLADCQKYSEKSPEAKKFVDQLLEKASDSGLLALMKKIDPDFGVVTSFSKTSIFKFKEAENIYFWKEIYKPIFYAHLARFVEIRANYIKSILQKDLANYVDYMSTLEGDVLFDAIYDFCNSLSKTTISNHIARSLQSDQNLLSILRNSNSTNSTYVRSRRGYPKKKKVDTNVKTESLIKLVDKKEKEIDKVTANVSFELIRDPRVFQRADVIGLILKTISYDEDYIYKKSSNKIIPQIEFQDIEPKINEDFEPPKISQTDLESMLLKIKTPRKTKEKLPTKKAPAKKAAKLSHWDEDEDEDDEDDED